ncbi:hypothetical protein EDD22DRAFT_896565 [Suillus occidentalis]|nr:hypothetical protein EDD22DRAFT_896565 [Suillus occidentalis]
MACNRAIMMTCSIFYSPPSMAFMTTFVQFNAYSEILPETPNHETNGIDSVCFQSEESNTVHIRHTQNIGTNYQI